MLLYLVHHAMAKTEGKEADRRLTEAGRRDVRKVASFLHRSGLVKVDTISHSGKTRAVQTAAILSEALHPANGLKKVEGLAPLDSPEIWGHQLSDASRDTMLVGHLPNLSRLASLLLRGDEGEEVVAFRNGCVTCLEREEGSWSLRWMLTPELLSREPDPSVLGRTDRSRFRSERIRLTPPQPPKE